jgi:hypothetical protein
MISAYLHGIGVLGPGLDGWQQTRSILRGDAPYQPTEVKLIAPSLLPANERRRTTRTIRLALQVAQMAFMHAGLDPAKTPHSAVFACADGDLDITDKICQAIHMDGHPVSPIQFHNSVHNAPAGYWMIGCRAQQPASSIAADSYTFGAGLLELLTTIGGSNQPGLLVAYDLPAPEPLLSAHPLPASFGCALLLSSDPIGALARMELIDTAPDPGRLSIPALNTLTAEVPAAHALHLLKSVAAGDSADLAVPAATSYQLQLRVTAC